MRNRRHPSHFLHIAADGKRPVNVRQWPIQSFKIQWEPLSERVVFCVKLNQWNIKNLLKNMGHIIWFFNESPGLITNPIQCRFKCFNFRIRFSATLKSKLLYQTWPVTCQKSASDCQPLWSATGAFSYLNFVHQRIFISIIAIY